MVHGTLEVLLVGAKGLENTDYLCTCISLTFNKSSYALLSILYFSVGGRNIWDGIIIIPSIVYS